MTKPATLPKDFSLYPRANGQYAKKIRGKLHYFGVVSDPEAAWSKYLDERDDLQAGRTPKRDGEVRLTVKQLCDIFYAAKEAKFNTKELSQTMLGGYYRICEMLVSYFGPNRIVEELKPADFANLRVHFAKGVGLVTLGNRVQHARVVFRYASEEDYIEHPLKFGQDFKRPKRQHLRAERRSKPAKLFTASEIRKIIATANQPLKAMVLLGINCGFGQSDCSRLPLTAIDLKKGWIDFPRPKTQVSRLCPLWPETVAAMREAIDHRRPPASAEYEHLAFITRTGVEFVRATEKRTNIDGVAQEFGKVLRKLSLSGSRRAFYALRHTFETISGDAGDQIATDMIMGHAPDSDDMSATYREKVFGKRLRKAVDHVRKWLFPKPARQKAMSKKESGAK